MQYLLVKNWEEFQHYKDRSPPWIKVHRTLLDDYEFAALPDESKAHLILIWVLASQLKGRVPCDPLFIKQKTGAKKVPNLQILVDAGFLIVEQDASAVLAERKQDASAVLALARSREERRGEERQKALARAVSLPAGFGISERVREWAAEKGHGNLEQHLEGFVSYVRRNGKRYVDWDEALMSAIREDWAKVADAPRSTARPSKQVAL